MKYGALEGKQDTFIEIICERFAIGEVE